MKNFGQDTTVRRCNTNLLSARLRPQGLRSDRAVFACLILLIACGQPPQSATVLVVVVDLYYDGDIDDLYEAI